MPNYDHNIMVDRAVVQELIAKPGLYLKVYIWILANAEYYGPKYLQCHTSVNQLRKDLTTSWGNTEEPTYNQMRYVIDYLSGIVGNCRKKPFKKERFGQGLIITILNHP